MYNTNKISYTSIMVKKMVNENFIINDENLKEISGESVQLDFPFVEEIDKQIRLESEDK
jgi:hypothetical protein